MAGDIISEQRAASSGIRTKIARGRFQVIRFKRMTCSAPARGLGAFLAASHAGAIFGSSRNFLGARWVGTLQ
jgi:hypothetical protein